MEHYKPFFFFNNKEILNVLIWVPQYNSNWGIKSKVWETGSYATIWVRKEEMTYIYMGYDNSTKIIEVVGKGSGWWKQQKVRDRDKIFYYFEQEKVPGWRENIAGTGVRQSWFCVLVLALSDSTTLFSLSLSGEDNTTTCRLESGGY